MNTKLTRDRFLAVIFAAMTGSAMVAEIARYEAHTMRVDMMLISTLAFVLYASREG